MTLKRIKLPCVLLCCVLLLGCVFHARQAHAEDVRGDDIVAYARTFLGYPYESGAFGPDAFDCSGFVYFIFKHFGIELPHGSKYFREDPEAYGTVVGRGSYANARAGDVISWEGHVGIYTADGTVVEALNHKYGVVERFEAEKHPSGRDFFVIRINGVIPGGGRGEPSEPTTYTPPHEEITGFEDELIDISARRRGDVNGDDKVTAKDARLVLRAAARLLPLTENEEAAADVTRDGRINTRDARMILRAAARLDTL